MQGEGGANSLLIAVESPIELSHFVVVGVNLAIALCPTDTLAGVLLSQVPRVVSARHGLMIEGGATRFAERASSTARCCSRCLRAASQSTMCWVR